MELRIQNIELYIQKLPLLKKDESVTPRILLKVKAGFLCPVSLRETKSILLLHIIQL